MLNWAKQFDTFCFLDNHQYNIAPHTEECLLAAGVKRTITATAGTALAQLDAFIQEKKSWLFGHLGYDLKNEIEQVTSSHADPIGFADLFFFEPEIVIRFSQNQLQIEAQDPESVFHEIEQQSSAPANARPLQSIQGRMTREEYIAVISRLRQHILRGDCYEINYCQEFFSAGTPIDPVAVYHRLCAQSPNPFSALYRVKDQWLLCASPERFLKKSGSTLLSQPIKGTSRRYPADAQQDLSSLRHLEQSAKDRSENVMVVDLVRNDLARICAEGSVKVDELFGLYSFPQVHQMISTVSGQVKKELPFSAIIGAMFPMGSMTGAPKKRVMELIEQYECSRRGIFSGAVGYVSPEGDFDFNVVIRSIMYNQATAYTSFQAGSGITFYSDPVQEWEECQLKAAVLREVLQAKQ